MEKPIGAKTDEEEAAVDVELEESMQFIRFRITHASPQCIEGRFVVDERSCQAFGVLHGGVSALIAESLGSFGAFLASGSKRVAGIQLTINHLRAAPVGMEVFVSAKPAQTGKRIQVWDVTFFEVVDPAKPVSDQITDASRKLAVSRVTVMAGLTRQARDVSNEEPKIHARL